MAQVISKIVFFAKINCIKLKCYEICNFQFAIKGDAMLNIILTMNGWAQGWLGIMGAVLWQSACS